ncbi:MAG: hypothetical protein ACK4MW_00455 [Aquificaceae bacterium]
MEALRAFFEITLRYTDLKWARSRDDLISKCIKVLRALIEGKSLQEIRENKDLSFGIEDSLEFLEVFVREHPQEVEKLIKVLGMYIKSPSPCKTRMISFAEVLLENRTASKGEEV